MNRTTSIKFLPAALLAFGLLTGACSTGGDAAANDVASLPTDATSAQADESPDLSELTPAQAQIASDECYERLGFMLTDEQLADEVFMEEWGASEPERVAQAEIECSPLDEIASDGQELSADEIATREDAFLAQDKCMEDGGFSYDAEDLDALIEGHEDEFNALQDSCIALATSIMEGGG